MTMNKRTNRWKAIKPSLHESVVNWKGIPRLFEKNTTHGDWISSLLPLLCFFARDNESAHFIDNLTHVVAKLLTKKAHLIGLHSPSTHLVYYLHRLISAMQNSLKRNLSKNLEKKKSTLNRSYNTLKFTEQNLLNFIGIFARKND